MGSYMVVVSQDFRQRQLELAQRMTYLELNTDPAYMEQYTGALFLPHTDPAQFPSVKVTSPVVDFRGSNADIDLAKGPLRGPATK